MAPDKDRAFFHQLDGHEDRISRMEDFNLQFAPLIARIDEKLETITSAVGELKVGLQEVKQAASEDSEKDLQRDHRVALLETAAADRRKTMWSIVKWVGGIVASVVTLAIGMFLGMK